MEGMTSVLIISLLFFSVAYTEQTVPDEPSDVAIVEELNVTSDKAGEMPESFEFELNLINGDNPVQLNLTKNHVKNERQKIAVVRKYLNGKTYITTENIPVENNVAMYQDEKTRGVFTVTCEGFLHGECEPVLLGSLTVKNEEYEFEPMEEKHGFRVKRNALPSKRKKLYSIRKKKKQRVSTNDYKKEAKNKNVKFNWKNSKSFRTRSRVATFNSKPPKDSKTQARKQVERTVETDLPIAATNIYYLSLVVVVDHSIYMKWYNASKETSERLRDIDAKSKIRMYFAHVVNGIDLRFNNIREHDFAVKIVVAEYVIADNPEFSIWTNKYTTAKPPFYVSVRDSLNKLVDWRKFHKHGLPPHDHIMLFTGENLYEERSDDPSVTGYAHVRTVCTDKSASVNEEHGGFGGIITATHELGHSLGANHDGEWNPCQASDQYIMTALGGDINPSNQQNPWRFSECSIQYFRDYIQELTSKGENCLTDDPVMLHEKEFKEHIKIHPGQTYGPNAQCKQLVGAESYYGWGGGLGEFRDVCTNMACKNTSSTDKFILFNAARGTSCGDKRWCINGQCVWGEKAPAKDGNCIHGDSLKPIKNSNCLKLIKENPARCYSKENQEFCCGSCKKRYTGMKNCEYGDKVTSCILIKSKPYLCYDQKNSRLCCKSCADAKSKVKGCEYGDRKSDCNVKLCNRASHKLNCCKTCSPENIKKMREQSKPKPKPTTPKPRTRPNSNRQPSSSNTNQQRATPWTRRFFPFPTNRRFTLTVSRTPAPETKTESTPTNRNRRPIPLSSPTATNRHLIPSPYVKGQCIDRRAFYRPDVPCEFLSHWLPLCSDSRFKRACCRRCNIERSLEIEIECVDRPNCMARTGADCYNQTNLENCCATCSSFETGLRLCKYGDKDARCSRMVRIFPQYYCDNYGDTCCDSCYRVPDRREPAPQVFSSRRSRPSRVQDRTIQRSRRNKAREVSVNDNHVESNPQPRITQNRVQPRNPDKRRRRPSSSSSVSGKSKQKFNGIKNLFDKVNRFLSNIL